MDWRHLQRRRAPAKWLGTALVAAAATAGGCVGDFEIDTAAQRPVLTQHLPGYCSVTYRKAGTLEPYGQRIQEWEIDWSPDRTSVAGGRLKAGHREDAQGEVTIEDTYSY